MLPPSQHHQYSRNGVARQWAKSAGLVASLLLLFALPIGAGMAIRGRVDLAALALVVGMVTAIIGTAATVLDTYVALRQHK